MSQSGKSDHACRKCGSPDVRVEVRNDPDKPVKLTCLTCRAVTWPPKPGNENRRRDHNAKWRKTWRIAQGGELQCLWCLARESEKLGSFVIDHRIPLEAGGYDTEANTMPLCPECHTERHAHQRTVQHLLGRSARDWKAA